MDRRVLDYFARQAWPRNDLCKQVEDKLRSFKTAVIFMGSCCFRIDDQTVHGRDLHEGQIDSADGSLESVLDFLLTNYFGYQLLRTYFISDPRSIAFNDLFKGEDGFFYARCRIQTKDKLRMFLKSGIEQFDLVACSRNKDIEWYTEAEGFVLMSCFDQEGYLLIT